MSNRLMKCAALALASLVTMPVMADRSDNPSLAADWLFSGGTAFTRNDPKIGLGNPDVGNVSLIDLDRLGVDDSDQDLYGAVHWQGLNRWRFGFSTYVTSVDGGRFTDVDYTYGDLTIPAGSGVSVDTESRFYILNAHYAIWQRPNWEAGAGFGVYALDWEGEIALVSGAGGSRLDSEAEDFLAPLPTLALYGRYAFTERLAGYASVDWLSLDIGDYDGEVFALTAGVDWWFSKRWGISGGVQIVDIDVVKDNDQYDIFVDANWESLFVKLNLAF